MKTLADLKKDYQYMFAAKNIGISIAKGWMPIFAQLCKDIDDVLNDDKLDFHWVQCKEKFGAARFYYSIKNCTPGIKINLVDETGEVKSYDIRTEDKREKTVSDQVDELINKATKKTNTSCIVCGDPAEVNSTNRYFLVLCKTHAKKRANDELEYDFWMS
jgi:hypothetical protein